ncbi:uncharacterized protein LOC110735992 [Chenopodium quinoa]|uniref:uncharacterized protein LOC110735992 n=1 Tax=Chenopodium quinoa TaxID=63459 RepID=UPI000B77034C|nr:uncharacterized protein LOC110735992 [Chenopodium quinoa]
MAGDLFGDLPPPSYLSPPSQEQQEQQLHLQPHKSVKINENNKTTSIIKDPTPLPPPPLKSAFKRSKPPESTPNEEVGSGKKLRFKTSTDASISQIAEAMQKIASHIGNSAKFSKASKLAIQLIQAGSVKPETADHFFSILEAAMFSPTSCNNASARSDYHALFSAAQDAKDCLNKKQKNQLTVWTIRAVVANDLYTDDSFCGCSVPLWLTGWYCSSSELPNVEARRMHTGVLIHHSDFMLVLVNGFISLQPIPSVGPLHSVHSCSGYMQFSKAAGRVKDLISNLPVATKEDDAEEVAALQDEKERVSREVQSSQDVIPSDLSNEVTTKEEFDPFGLDALISSKPKKEAKNNKGKEDEEEMMRFLRLQREAIINCLEIAAKRYKIPWCQTVIDILVKHAYDNVSRFTSQQRDAIGKLWTSIREQLNRRKQGKSVSGKLDVTAFESLQEKYSNEKISIRRAVGGTGDRRCQQWLG